jgi:hypothetical protein
MRVCLVLVLAILSANSAFADEQTGVDTRRTKEILEGKPLYEYYDSTILESWNCTEPLGKEILVVAVRFRVEGDAHDQGAIKLAGTTQYGSYEVKGFDRRFDFGNSGDYKKPDYIYAFIIKPDGTGLYFDFSKESSVQAALYECKQVK